MKLKEWAELIYLDPTIPFREPPSKHQKQILSIILLIKKAKNNPSDEYQKNFKTLSPLIAAVTVPPCDIAVTYNIVLPS